MFNSPVNPKKLHKFRVKKLQERADCLIRRINEKILESDKDEEIYISKSLFGGFPETFQIVLPYFVKKGWMIKDEATGYYFSPRNKAQPKQQLESKEAYRVPPKITLRRWALHFLLTVSALCLAANLRQIISWLILHLHH